MTERSAIYQGKSVFPRVHDTHRANLRCGQMIARAESNRGRESSFVKRVVIRPEANVDLLQRFARDIGDIVVESPE